MSKKKRTPKQRKVTEKFLEAGKATRFHTGDPRINRSGRPKYMPKLKELMLALLGGEEGDDLINAPIAQVVKALISETKNHNLGAQRVAAAKEIMERAFGKTKQADEEIDSEGKRQTITGFNIKRK